MGYKIEPLRVDLIKVTYDHNGFSDEDAKTYRSEIEILMNNAKGQNKLLKNLIYPGPRGHISLEGREMFKELNKDPRNGNAAIIGGDRFTKMITHFILIATGQNNIRFFDNEDSALEWLNNSD